MFQMEEYVKTSKEELLEVEIGKLPKKVFR